MDKERRFANPFSANPHSCKHPSWKEEILQTPSTPYGRKRSCKPLKPLMKGRDRANPLIPSWKEEILRPSWKEEILQTP